MAMHSNTKTKHMQQQHQTDKDVSEKWKQRRTTIQTTHTQRATAMATKKYGYYTFIASATLLVEKREILQQISLSTGEKHVILI